MMIWARATQLLRNLIFSLLVALHDSLTRNFGAESLIWSRVAIKVDYFFIHDCCIFFNLWLIFIFSLLEILIVTNIICLVLFSNVNHQGLLRAAIVDTLD